MSLNEHEAFRSFVEMVASLTKDGEKLDGDGDPWEMSNDDAWETLHALISEARTLLNRPDPPDLRGASE